MYKNIYIYKENENQKNILPTSSTNPEKKTVTYGGTDDEL
jgi:hypothetical protein